MITKIKPYIAALSIGTIAMLSSCGTTNTIHKSNKEVAYNQAVTDSLFYRNIFNQTTAANDSVAVAEFNKIAAEMKNIKSEKRSDLSREILTKAESFGITQYEKNIIKGVQYISNHLALQLKQQLADKFVYEKFFQKHGISDKLEQE